MTLPAIPIENAGQVAMLVTSGACIFVTTVLVVLRFVARHKIGCRTLDASDLCIAAALASSPLMTR